MGELDLRRPDLLTLDVADLSRSLAFWNGLLRIPVRLRTERHAELQCESVTLVLVETGEAARTARTSPAIGFEVDDLDAAIERLASLGVTAALLPEGPGPLAGRRARFADPDGHALELVRFDVP